MRRTMLLTTLLALLACDEDLDGAHIAMSGDASLDGMAPSSDGQIVSSDSGGQSLAALCTSTGGTVRSTMCCNSSSSFPDLCAVGPCSCAPENSRLIPACVCPENQCFTTAGGCRARLCTPGADQSCNDDPSISSLHGRCNDDFTCTCEPQFMKNPATGRCR